LDWSVCLTRSTVEAELRTITLGHPLLDDYLAFSGSGRGPTPGWRSPMTPSPKVGSVDGGTLTSRSSKSSWSALRSWPGRSGYRRATS
jgi:hypothetical protein